jgi:hypothetical protein
MAEIVLAEWLEATGGDMPITATGWSGQGFLALATAKVTRLTLEMRNLGGTGNVHVVISAADANSKPTGGPLAESTAYPASAFNQSAREDFSFAFDGTVELVQGTRYCAYVKSTVGSQEVGVDFTQYSGGKFIFTSNSGGSWTDNVNSLRFGVYGGAGGGGGNIPTDVTLFESWGF